MLPSLYIKKNWANNKCLMMNICMEVCNWIICKRRLPASSMFVLPRSSSFNPGLVFDDDVDGFRGDVQASVDRQSLKVFPLYNHLIKHLINSRDVQASEARQLKQERSLVKLLWLDWSSVGEKRGLSEKMRLNGLFGLECKYGCEYTGVYEYDTSRARWRQY